MRRGGSLAPSIRLEHGSGVSLVEQLCRQIEASIRRGELPDGARLPSTRLLAEMLGISRNTTVAAYDELVARDLLRGRQGSGMRVRSPGLPVPFEQVKRAAQFPERMWPIADPDGNVLYLRH